MKTIIRKEGLKDYLGPLFYIFVPVIYRRERNCLLKNKYSSKNKHSFTVQN